MVVTTPYFTREPISDFTIYNKRKKEREREREREKIKKRFLILLTINTIKSAVVDRKSKGFNLIAI